jgi:hypothetical protein
MLDNASFLMSRGGSPKGGQRAGAWDLGDAEVAAYAASICSPAGSALRSEAERQRGLLPIFGRALQIPAVLQDFGSTPTFSEVVVPQLLSI